MNVTAVKFEFYYILICNLNPSKRIMREKMVNDCGCTMIVQRNAATKMSDLVVVAEEHKTREWDNNGLHPFRSIIILI